MELDYRTKGTCASNIHVELDGRKIKRVVFTGGCNGNLQGISPVSYTHLTLPTT